MAAQASYNAKQLMDLWTQAGGSSNQAPIMAAIALAESGGNPTAHNPSGASGLWQILGQPFPGNVYDPLTNAKMAVAKYKSQGLGAWTTYTTGAWKKYEPAVQQAMLSGGAIQSGAGAVTGAVGSAVSAVGSTATEIGRIADLVTSGQFWLRVGGAIAGVILLVLGLHALTGQSSSVGDQAKKVTRIVPVPV